ncbi:hypothetical protein CBR_g5656 [Chara braunii]|uniref:Leucine zipper transcription factor-like protein 1 n=1 Tax=Chara braunii TaxID=69332 RepID=A0A388JS02_CHABU|nr:hypothetical protein CBR_g5656 [Chara braunii]|eukprot:GBG60482.1 hypothetical protein CBR_g5656 [Chara braunii]
MMAAASTARSATSISQNEQEISDHELQVLGFLRFLRMKRMQHVREISSLFRDYEKWKLEDAIYTKNNVLEMLSALATEVTHALENELENNAHANALLLKLIFQQAEEAGFLMYADFNQLENMNLLAEMKSSEQAVLNKPATAFTVKSQKLRKIAGSGTDPHVIIERDTLREEVHSLNDKLTKLQAQVKLACGILKSTQKLEKSDERRLLALEIRSRNGVLTSEL